MRNWNCREREWVSERKKEAASTKQDCEEEKKKENNKVKVKLKSSGFDQ